MIRKLIRKILCGCGHHMYSDSKVVMTYIKSFNHIYQYTVYMPCEFCGKPHWATIYIPFPEYVSGDERGDGDAV